MCNRQLLSVPAEEVLSDWLAAAAAHLCYVVSSIRRVSLSDIVVL